ncbi:hypothetical protein E2C01_032070 [Portunus trituberculatus]|uniref:Uncharacterized protein n=1 Tax=Portunus trituberculatus TaxID=210409 RepID=A0A5B7EV34_PORTR|nr:hypothetical protein [Portunus trituberculatus]
MIPHKASGDSLARKRSPYTGLTHSGMSHDTALLVNLLRKLVFIHTASMRTVDGESGESRTGRLLPACLPASLSHHTRRGCLAAWEPDFDQLSLPHVAASDNKRFCKQLTSIGAAARL